MNEKDLDINLDDIPDDVLDILSGAIEYLNTYGEAFIISNMMIHLNHFRVKELKDIAKRFGLSKLSKYKKGELMELVEPYLLDEKKLEKKLLVLSDLAYKALTKRVYKEDSLTVFEVSALEDLANDGYLMITADGDIAIPKEIVAVMKKITKKKSFQEKRRKLAFMNALFGYADYIYGVIDENLMKIMFETRFKNTSDREFMSLYNELEHPLMVHQGKEFISTTVLDQDAYDIVKQTHESHVISLLSEEEIADYMNYGFPYSKQCYKRFYDSLFLFFRVEPLDAADVCRHIFSAICIDQRMQNINDYISDYITFDSKDDLKMFMDLFMEISNETRHFMTNGNVPNKLVKNHLANGGVIPMPDDEDLQKALKEHIEDIRDMGFDLDEDGNISLKHDDDDHTGGFYS